MIQALRSMGLAGLVALAFALATASPGVSAVATTPVTLYADHYVDLGAGPFLLSARNGQIAYQIADSLPSGQPAGFPVSIDAPVPVQSASHVYAIAMMPGASAVVSPITSWGVGSGGTVTLGAGSATIGAVNQGAANAIPWNSNIAQLGGVSISTGAGATDSGTQRVTAASDSPTAPWANPLSTASLQRGTENTGNYTANTGWNNSGSATVFTFTNACRVNGGAVLIPEIDIYSSTNPTTKLQGIIWLFSSSIGTVIADNATFNIAAADFPNVTGPMQGIAFTLGSSQASGAANSAAALVGTTYEAKCAAGTTSIYGMVQVTNTSPAYAKANGETLTIKLRTIGIN